MVADETVAGLILLGEGLVVQNALPLIGSCLRPIR